MENKDSAKKFKIKGKVKTVSGSVLNPESGGLRFVLNFSNNVGKSQDDMSKLFDKKWRKLKEEVRGWYTNKTGAYKYGAINRTAVQSDVEIVSLLCQDPTFKTDPKGLESCMKELSKLAVYEKASVHISDLMLKSVPELSALVTSHLTDNGVTVYFYEGDKV